jgi:calcium-translocating P-type ATPase
MTTNTPPPWHALEPRDALASLGATLQGLAPDEVSRRRAEHGPNRLVEARPPSVFALILHQFTSPLIYILLAAAGVTLLLQEWIDAGVIGAVLLLNAIIGFTQERRAEMAVHALSRLVSPKARVVRQGIEVELESADIVPGDIIRLESGQRVPADLRLVKATNLHIDESLLTGESLPVQKRVDPVAPDAPIADRRCIAHAGSVVTTGRATGLVVAIGERTAIGAIAHDLRETRRGETPLQQRMGRFANLVGVVVGASATLAMVIGTLAGEKLSDMFLVAVALAVAAIPEGLPVVFTITLAVGVRRMAARNAIVRRLPAVETLGSTTVIGSDKTGTLTENKMTVTTLIVGDREIDALGADIEPSDDAALREALLAGVLANEATLTDGEEGQGDPSELALLVVAARLGVDPGRARARAEVVHDIPFESELRYAATFVRLDDALRVFVKGAPERVAAMCATDANGDPLDHDALHATTAALAARGLRLLALAGGTLDADTTPGPGALAGLRLYGVAGMMDPPRAGVREAIAGCHAAGIRVLMMTGDHAATARAIALQLDLLREGDEVITGAELDTLDERALADRLDRIAVFARTAPEQKLRIVHALEEIGETVAVTGDGVNDAPALKAAAIGVAMGRGGTDVAREASDMVLTDDNFVSIQAAVEEGRITFANLRKATFFLISTGAGAIGTILGALALGMPLPMLPAQLLWLNLVTNGLQDVALAFEPGDPDVRTDPPRPRDEGIISGLLWERTVVTGIVLTVGTLWMFDDVLTATGSLGQAQTAALTTMVLFQAFQVGNARSERRSVFTKSPFSNRFLLLATIAALSAHIGALHWGPLQAILRVEPLHDPWTWPRMIATASTIIVAMELHKLVRRRYPRAPRR